MSAVSAAEPAALKVVFVDRDGTLIEEPPDSQVDSLTKVRFMPGVFAALTELVHSGFRLVMVTNQDGLGTERFPRASFEEVQAFLLETFSSQGIDFDAVLVCPHRLSDRCRCRKPKTGLVTDYLRKRDVDRTASAVIGDRDTDLKFGANLKVRALRVRRNGSAAETWPEVVKTLLSRRAEVSRQTAETQLHVRVNLDTPEPLSVSTGIGFFDHMLMQLAKHGGFALELTCQGDLHVDEHHTVEDSALALGEAIRRALGEKRGIARYGFLLPMDEAEVAATVDLSGRPYAEFSGRLGRETVGNFPTELVPHFFRSLSDSLRATIHVFVRGENTHHMIEACFKGVGRSLRQAFRREGLQIPSTKGVL
jgi:imidazoleglycerol-phosphate dehydratase / histidinol-phosphatase